MKYLAILIFIPLILTGEADAASSQNFSISDGSMSGAGTSSSSSYSNTANVFMGEGMQSSSYSVGGSSSVVNTSSSQPSNAGSVKRVHEAGTVVLTQENTEASSSNTTPAANNASRSYSANTVPQEQSGGLSADKKAPINPIGAVKSQGLSEQKELSVTEVQAEEKKKGVAWLILAIVALLAAGGAQLYLSKNIYTKIPKGKFPLMKSWKEY